MKKLITLVALAFLITACGTGTDSTRGKLVVTGVARPNPQLETTCAWNGAAYDVHCISGASFDISITNQSNELAKPVSNYLTPQQMTDHDPEYRMTWLYGGCSDNSVRPRETISCRATYLFEQYRHTVDGQRIFSSATVPLAAIEVFDVVVTDPHLGLETQLRMPFEYEGGRPY